MAELDHSKICQLCLKYFTLPLTFIGFVYHRSQLLKTASVWVCVVDHKPSPLSHLTKVAVGVVEVPGNQDDHHRADFNAMVVVMILKVMMVMVVVMVIIMMMMMILDCSDVRLSRQVKWCLESRLGVNCCVLTIMNKNGHQYGDRGDIFYDDDNGDTSCSNNEYKIFMMAMVPVRAMIVAGILITW